MKPQNNKAKPKKIFRKYKGSADLALYR